MPPETAPRTALLLVVVLLLAGCNAPAGTAQTSPTEVPSENGTSPTTTQPSRTAAANATIPVDGGRLGADPDRTFRWVTRRLGADVRPPERIQVIDPPETEATAQPPEFLQHFGVRAPESGMGLSGQTIGDDLVRINRSIATGPRIEGILVHEYVHVVQNRQGVTGRMVAAGVWESVPPLGGERPFLVESLREGVATHVADEYQRTHTDALPQGTRYERLYRKRETAGWRSFMAPYWFGYRYVADRLAANETIGSIYDRPPRTSEAILHRLEPGSEPPANLSVTVREGRWQSDVRGRVGELGTRLLLLGNLNVSQARIGADGWGNDVLVPYERGSEQAYVWVVRWDDPANETEFQSALTTALNRQGTRTDTGWRDGETAFRVRQGDARTTVVVVGPSAFVRNASVDVGRQVVVQSS